jgi:PLP dependent protein
MSVDIAENIAKVRERIRAACVACARPADAVTLVAVSKTRPAAAIRAAVAAGAEDIGENYLQEALAKQPELADLPITWHFIGPIQSNKTRAIAEAFQWVHGVDRLKIAQRLSEQRPAALPPLNICLQVNISREATKAGVGLAELPVLIEAVSALPHLRLRGLMAIPRPGDTEACAALGAAFTELRRRWPQLDTLSLGMSADFEAAIAAGATHVRIGTDIFGARN